MKIEALFIGGFWKKNKIGQIKEIKCNFIKINIICTLETLQNKFEHFTRSFNFLTTKSSLN